MTDTKHDERMKGLAEALAEYRKELTNDSADALARCVEGFLAAEVDEASRPAPAQAGGTLFVQTDDRRFAATKDELAQGQREVVAPGAAQGDGCGEAGHADGCCGNARCLPSAKAARGTDAQILKERELTASAIRGAMAFGYQGVKPPPESDHWLAEFWEIGRRLRKLEQASKPSRFEWCCSKGCGTCGVKSIEFEYERTETKDGAFVSNKTEPQLVSACCAAPMFMWDNELDQRVELNIEVTREVEPRTVRMPLKEEPKNG
jgi:hypothetical protein